MHSPLPPIWYLNTFLVSMHRFIEETTTVSVLYTGLTRGVSFFYYMMLRLADRGLKLGGFVYCNGLMGKLKIHLIPTYIGQVFKLLAWRCQSGGIAQRIHSNFADSSRSGRYWELGSSLPFLLDLSSIAVLSPITDSRLLLSSEAICVFFSSCRFCQIMLPSFCTDRIKVLESLQHVVVVDDASWAHSLMAIV